MERPYWWRYLEPRELVIRGCGQPHTGTCWTERFTSWSRPGAWIPPEYRDGTWYRLTEEGRVPLSCSPAMNTVTCRKRKEER